MPFSQFLSQEQSPRSAGKRPSLLFGFGTCVPSGDFLWDDDMDDYIPVEDMDDDDE